MSESLTNKGISIIGSPADCRSNAIVVVGTARGGTSMVAGAMAKLGIFMGDKAVPPVFEDVRLSACFEGKMFDEARGVVSEYSASHPVWGWKRPSSIDYLGDVHGVLNSPRYVFIYKDIMSIAQRNAISMLAEILPGMERSLLQYGKTIDFLRSNNVHAMLVSYEKAMSESENFVDELIGFCSIQPNDDQITAAKKFITPNPEQYLDASRITKAQGRLGGVSGRKIYGWARLVHSKEPALVDLFLNEKKIATTIADKPRPDLLEKFGFACAFHFELSSDVEVRVGDKLRARVVNEVRDLENSPLIINQTLSANN